jgi:glycine C-acetyltransferase
MYQRSLPTTSEATEHDPEQTAEVALANQVSVMLANGSLEGTAAQFAQPRGANLLRRTAAVEAWHDVRSKDGLWQYTRSLDGAPDPIANIRDESGISARGINFASQDYLSLASHPSVAEAGARALRDAGPHSAGSAVLLGNTRYSLALEEALAALVQTEHVALFPTGWGAAFGAITALVQAQDHIVIDQFAHASLRQGANAATSNVSVSRHLDVSHVRQLLGAIRARDTQHGILVVTEGLFSMDSDTPDLAALQALCHEFDATLLVDVAHDLGAMGPDGGGCIAEQGMLGKIDLVMGAFSKSFASNGGFVATAARSVKRQLQLFAGPHMFSNALSPIQAAVIHECIQIIRSDEGQGLRADLMRNVEGLRDLLAKEQLTCLGIASPIVPVLIGSEKVSRLAGKLLFDQSIFVNQVEFPGVPVGASRLRLQLMSNHNMQQIRRAAPLISQTLGKARTALDAGERQRQQN